MGQSSRKNNKRAEMHGEIAGCVLDFRRTASKPAATNEKDSLSS